MELGHASENAVLGGSDCASAVNMRTAATACLVVFGWLDRCWAATAVAGAVEIVAFVLGQGAAAAPVGCAVEVLVGCFDNPVAVAVASAHLGSVAVAAAAVVVADLGEAAAAAAVYLANQTSAAAERPHPAAGTEEPFGLERSVVSFCAYLAPFVQHMPDR